MNILEQPKEKKLSTMDEYINKVYRLILLIVPGACECAGLAYTFSKLVGWLPTVNWISLIIFDITCLAYLLVAIYLIKTGIRNGYVINEKLKLGKIFIVSIMFIQFNFIVYMIPAKDFWGFAFFFIILTAFFLDYKMVTITSIEIFVSIIFSWFIQGNIHLPTKDNSFMVNMLDRIVCLILSISTIILFTYMINKFLENEVDKNTKQIHNVLTSVHELSEDLSAAGTSLSQISENGNASAEELATTSEQLVYNSNKLSLITDESISNLSELSRWENIVAEDVKKVEITSKNLLYKSKDNEILLNDLNLINDELSNSMKITTETALNLSESVKEIEITLNLINDISSSTNLLALNASIEAARAGESGKGFTVVATEVGNLANNTKESLKIVETVTEKIQQSVKDIATQVEENTKKLETQNIYFEKVFNSMKEMTELLNTSVNAIDTMEVAHNKQSEVIKKTVSINQNIADNIRNENKQFNFINVMAESNANDTSEVANQAILINNMVDKITSLLKSNY